MGLLAGGSAGAGVPGGGVVTYADPTKTVYARMRALRLLRGWSAQELADRLTAAGRPTKRSTIAMCETRPGGCGVDLLYALAEVFGVAISTLVDENTVLCPRCNDEPPDGFSCMTCGRSS